MYTEVSEESPIKIKKLSRMEPSLHRESIKNYLYSSNQNLSNRMSTFHPFFITSEVRWFVFFDRERLSKPGLIEYAKTTYNKQYVYDKPPYETS